MQVCMCVWFRYCMYILRVCVELSKKETHTQTLEGARAHSLMGCNPHEDFCVSSHHRVFFTIFHQRRREKSGSVGVGELWIQAPVFRCVVYAFQMAQRMLKKDKKVDVRRLQAERHCTHNLSAASHSMSTIVDLWRQPFPLQD